MTRRSGMSLIEMMIVLAIIGIIVALTLPGMIRAKVSSNERAISNSLKAISNAQQAASSTLFDGRYWTYNVMGLCFVEVVQTPIDTPGDYQMFLKDTGVALADLARGGEPVPGGDFIPADAAYTWKLARPGELYGADGNPKFEGRSGYVLRMHSNFLAGALQGTGFRWGVVACPMRYDRTGANCCIVDQEGRVYKRPWTGATTIGAGVADAGQLQGAFMANWPTSNAKAADWRVWIP